MPWIKSTDKKKGGHSFDIDHLVPPPPSQSKIPPSTSASVSKPVATDPVNDSQKKVGLKDILVIDDEPDFLELYETIITPLKLFRNVITAGDGSQALKKIQNQEFSLVIMDVRMPKMDGIKVLSSLHSSEFQKSLNGKKLPPILLVSGNIDGELAQQALKYKIKNILTKPFGKDDLIQKIKDVIKN